MGFKGGLGRGFSSSGRLGRGPRAIDFSSELLDLACQQGEGRVKGGAEEPKLLLGEGRGSGGSEEGGLRVRPSMSRVETPPNPGSGLASSEMTLGMSPEGSHLCSSHCST